MAENKQKAKKTEKSFSQSQVDEIVAQAVAKALEQQRKSPTVVNVTNTEEYVTVLFLGAIAEGTNVSLGSMGTINSDGSTIDIPKKEFMRGMGIPVVDSLLKERKLIVVNGLTDAERSRFGLVYKEGELLSQDAFFRLMDFDKEEIVSIYNALCDEHKKIVAKMYLTAYFEKHDNRVHLETLQELNKISKTIPNEKDGLFKTIIDDIGSRLSE